MSKKDRIKQLIDFLFQELGPEEEKELQEEIQANSELAKLKEQVESVLDMIDKTYSEAEKAPDILNRVLSKIMYEEDDQLSDEDLGKAVGGISKDEFYDDYGIDPDKEE